jgi:hypothetical protein
MQGPLHPAVSCRPPSALADLSLSSITLMTRLPARVDSARPSTDRVLSSSHRRGKNTSAPAHRQRA